MESNRTRTLILTGMMAAGMMLAAASFLPYGPSRAEAQQAGDPEALIAEFFGILDQGKQEGRSSSC